MNSTEAADAQPASGAAKDAAGDARSRRLGILGWFALLCLLAAVTLASYVIFHSYRFSLNTDGAVEDILAKLAVEEGRLVPQNWTYANGDLWILGPRLFLVIAFPWFGLGYLLHASATWLTYLYLLLMVFGVCRTIAPQHPRAAIFATVMAAGGISLFNFEFVIGEGAYSLYAALALAMFGLVSRQREHTTLWWPRVTTLFLAGTAAVLVCVSNATRGGVTVIVPLVVGWVTGMLLSGSPSRGRIIDRNASILVSIVSGTVIGFALFRYWLLPEVVNSAGAANFKLASDPEMLRHLTMLPSAWFTYFEIGGIWAGLPLLPRIVQCSAWVLSIGLLLAPAFFVFTFRHHAQAVVALSWIALACYAMTFVALIASKNLFAGFWSIRYATFGIYASICLLAIWIDEAMRGRAKASSTVAVLLCLVPVATIAAWRTEWTPGGVTYAQRMDLVSSLEQRNIGTVLATYWNSQVLTVLSDDKIEALPVDVDATTGLRRHAQNSPRVAARGFDGKQAIALTTAEAPAAVWTKLANQLGEPVQRYKSGPFQVAVYDRQLTRRFYDNDASADMPIASDKLMMELSSTTLAPCRSAHPCHYWIDVTNTGRSTLTTWGAKPFRLGIHGIDAQGNIVKWESGRIDFPSPILSGEMERVEAVLPRLADPRITRYQLCLLQEQVAWHCDRTRSHTDRSISR